MERPTAKHKSLARNSLLLFIAQIISAVFGISSSILIARIIGPYITGQYTYLVWIVTTFTAIGTLGIPNTLIKFIAEHLEGKKKEVSQAIAGNLLLLTTIIGILAAVVLSFLNYFHIFPNSIPKSYFYILALILPLTTLSSSLTAIFRGNRRYDSLMYAGLITSPVMFITILGILYFLPSLNGLIIYYIANTIISLIILAFFAKKNIKISFTKLPKKVSSSVLKFALSVSGILLLDQIVWNNSEVLFLGHYSAPEQVAFYTLSYTLTTNVMNLFPGSILGALMPHISALHGQKNKEEINSSYQTIAKYVGIIVAALVGGGVALAVPFIYTFYGLQYAHMVPVFRILIFSAGWSAIGGVTSAIIYGTTRQNFILKTGFILSIINIIFDFLIIPHFGALGAAIANGLAQFGGVFVGIYYLTKQGINFPVNNYIKLTSITIFSSVVTYLLTNLISINNLWNLIICSIFFFILYSYLLLTTKLIQYRKFTIYNTLINSRLSYLIRK